MNKFIALNLGDEPPQECPSCGLPDKYIPVGALPCDDIWHRQPWPNEELSANQERQDEVDFWESEEANKRENR